MSARHAQVLWENTLVSLVQAMGKKELYELGSGTQIKAMVKRIDMGIWRAFKNVQV